MSDAIFEENSRIILPHDKEAYLNKFGGVYEDSPHLVLPIWENVTRFGSDVQSVYLTENFHSATIGVVKSTSREQQLELITAHPDLGSQINPENMGESSQAEQKGSGLTDAPEEVKAAFGELNTEYKDKFGFPFILAVRGVDAQDKPAAMLEAMQQRINNNEDAEFETALKQIYKIAGYRLATIADTDKPNLAPEGCAVQNNNSSYMLA